MSTAARDRILDEAMHLFAAHGYKATSVARIEAAAGLTPGAGGLYHHFTSKQAVLAAGVERHLARLDALRDIRHLLTPLGDLRAELTVIARYALAELDREHELLRLLALEVRNRPEALHQAVETLISSTFGEFAAWLRSQHQPAGLDVEATAAVALGGLLSTRVLSTVLGTTPLAIDDERFVAAWVELMMRVLDRP